MLQNPSLVVGNSTWLCYDNARWYSTITGDFLSQDPSGSAGSGSNMYGFANDNPVTFADPSGLCPTNLWGGGSSDTSSGSGNFVFSGLADGSFGDTNAG